MDALMSYLPPHAGLLPKWLLLLAAVSMGNTIQSYITTNFTAQVYSNTPSPFNNRPSAHAPVTPLQSRTFGTWTFLGAVVRMYAAYNIDNPQIYQLALWTFVVAMVHFYSEWLWFGTARWSKGLWPSAIIAPFSLVWMLSVWGWYVR